MCDSYIGLDVTETVTIDVKKPLALVDVADDQVVVADAAAASATDDEEGFWYYLGGASFWEGYNNRCFFSPEIFFFRPKIVFFDENCHFPPEIVIFRWKWFIFQRFFSRSN